MLTVTAILFFGAGYMFRRYQMQITNKVKSALGKSDSSEQ